MDIGKKPDFAKWQKAENISDRDLCDAVAEMERGLTGASLGGKVFKKRIARPGGGKSSGFRTLVAAKTGSRYVFIHGFAKNAQDNIEPEHLAKIQIAAKAFMSLDATGWTLAVKNGLLIEVLCDEEAH